MEGTFQEDPIKHKIYKEDEKIRKWIAKKTKQANAQMWCVARFGTIWTI